MNFFLFISKPRILLPILLCVIVSGCAVRNVTYYMSLLQEQYFIRPLHNYVNQSESPKDFIRFAEIELDKLKLIAPQESSSGIEDSIFLYKSSLIKELLNIAEKNKDTSLMIRSNILRTRSEIAYCERYPRINHKTTKQEIGLLYRKEYVLFNHCDTAIKHLATNIETYGDTPSVFLIIELKIIQVETIENRAILQMAEVDSLSNLSWGPGFHPDIDPPITFIANSIWGHAIPLLESILTYFKPYRQKNETVFIKAEQKLNELKKMTMEEYWQKSRNILK